MSEALGMPIPPNPPHTQGPVAQSDDSTYLWDRTGTPEAEIVRLEESLQGFGYQGQSGAGARLRISTWRSTRRMTLVGAAAAAIILVGVIIILILPKPPLQIQGWDLASRSGEITIERMEWYDQLNTVAQRVATSKVASAMLVATSGAKFHLEGESSVLLVNSSFTPRLQLEHGKIYSDTWTGPPCEVRTPAGIAFVTGDTAGLISWRDEGRGVIELKTGHVEFRSRGVETHANGGMPAPIRLLAGMSCDLSMSGASIPVDSSAQPLYRKQLAMVALSAGAKIDVKTRFGQLDELLERSRAEDAPTLWNLCWHVGESERRMIADRIGILLSIKDAIDTDRDGKIDPGSMQRMWDTIERLRKGSP